MGYPNYLGIRSLGGTWGISTHVVVLSTFCCVAFPPTPRNRLPRFPRLSTSNPCSLASGQLCLKPCDGQSQHNASTPAREEGTSIAPDWQGSAKGLCVWMCSSSVRLTNDDNSVISALVVLLVQNTSLGIGEHVHMSNANLVYLPLTVLRHQREAIYVSILSQIIPEVRYQSSSCEEVSCSAGRSKQWRHFNRRWHAKACPHCLRQLSKT